MEDRLPAAPALTLRVEPFDSPGATAMIDGANRTNTALYGHADQSPLEGDEFSPRRRGRFIVAYLDGSAIGCGGYRTHHDDTSGATAEIKRMYIEPHARRHGVARALLARLEADARADGYHAVILDTGSKQHEAHNLYESCGYIRTAGFGIYRDKPGNRAYLKTFTCPA